MSKKTKIGAIIMAVFLLCCFTIFSFADEIKLKSIESKMEFALDTKKDLSTSEVSERIGEGKRSDIKKILQNKGYYTDDINIALSKYIETSVMFDMNNEEHEYLMALTDMGYDFERVIEIYNFLKNTNEKITAIRPIYDIANPDFEDSWIENAYDIYLGDKSCSLSVEDVINYVNQGISIEDITMCYEISLDSDKNIKQMLDEKVGGKDWQDIVIPKLSQKKQTNKMNLKDITTAVAASRKTGIELYSVIGENEKGIGVKQEVMQKIADKNQRIMELKDKHGIVKNDDETIIKAAKRELNGVSESTIKELVSKGYRIKEIKGAIKGEKRSPDAKEILEVINSTEE